MNEFRTKKISGKLRNLNHNLAALLPYLRKCYVHGGGGGGGGGWKWLQDLEDSAADPAIVFLFQ